MPRLWTGASLALLLIGCGPARSTAIVVDAQAELAAAEAANAAQLAPFEYVAAEAYLHKAREEQSYAEFEVSIDYGRKALSCARVARMRAEGAQAAKMGGTRPTRSTKTKCLPGPDRPNLPPADEEPAAGGSALSGAPAPAPRRPGQEPADPPPAPPRRIAGDTPIALPDGDGDEDGPLPEGERGEDQTP